MGRGGGVEIGCRGKRVALLPSELERVMIHVFVHIEQTEWIIRVTGPHVMRNRTWAINGDEVSCTPYSVDMNDGEVRWVVRKTARLNYPHARVLVWRITDLVKPSYDSTWIDSAVVIEGEKCQNSCNIAVLQACFMNFSGVSAYEDTISSGAFPPPIQCRSNIFSLHALDSTDITWRIKPWRRWIECIYTSIEARVLRLRYKLRVTIIMRIKLLE